MVTLDDGLAHFDTTIHREVLPVTTRSCCSSCAAARHNGRAEPSPLGFHRSRFGRLHAG